MEWDHVCRLSESFGEQEFQPLCPACHKEKTEKEARSYDEDQLASHFEKVTWDQYVASPRPPPLAYRVKQVPDEFPPGFEIADVRRCRKNTLEYCTHPLPVFCPLDDVKRRAEPVLGDLNFVTKPYKTFVSQLGYAGVGWQHRVQTEWLLHTGVIDWGDITHVLNATAHLPASILAEPLRTMEAAWCGDEVHAKLAVNSLIGLWAIDECYSHKLRSSTYESDAPPGALKQTFHHEGGLVYDFITTTNLIGNASCRPLHDLCMGTEALRVGQMLYSLKQARAVVYEIKTDSVLYKPLKRIPPKLAELRFRDLDTLRAQLEPSARGAKRLDERHLVSPIPSDEVVFRVMAATEADLMKSTPQLPSRTWDLKEHSRTWRTLSADEAEGRALDGESLVVHGVAGTGKTTFLQGVVERPRARGKKVDIVSKTHVAYW